MGGCPGACCPCTSSRPQAAGSAPLLHTCPCGGPSGGQSSPAWLWRLPLASATAHTGERLAAGLGHFLRPAAHSAPDGSGGAEVWGQGGPRALGCSAGECPSPRALPPTCAHHVLQVLWPTQPPWSGSGPEAGVSVHQPGTGSHPHKSPCVPPARIHHFAEAAFTPAVKDPRPVP